MATEVPLVAATHVSDARARRREIEKQSRLRREQNLRAMRDQVATLQRVLHCLERPLLLPEFTEEDDELAALIDPEDGENERRAEDARLRAFLRRSLALVAESKLLRDERFRLISLLGKRQQFEASVRTAIAARRAELGENGEDQYERHAAAAGVAGVVFEPWAPDAVAAHVRDSLDAIGRFSANTDHVSSGHQFLGWSDSRRLDVPSGRLQFSFSKTFPNTDAAQLFDKFWALQFSADKLRHHNLGSSTKVRLTQLQRVSRDITIQRREIQYVGMATCFNTVLLIFRQRTPTGFMACMRTVAAPAIQRAVADDPQAAWVSHFHWTHIDAVDDADGRGPTSCRLSFCGSVATEDAALAQRWMLELAMMLVRGETTLRLGPRQLPM